MPTEIGASVDLRDRKSLVLYVALTILFSTLVTDGFPAGIAVLREFGSRLTNFILLGFKGVNYV